MRRLYACLWTWCTCWDPSVLPGDALTAENSSTGSSIFVEPVLSDLARQFPHTLHAPTNCRTEIPQGERLHDLVRGLDVTIQAHETHGGMGRIYALEDPSKVVKIADIGRSWCKYEPQNYDVLQMASIPCGALYTSAVRLVDGTTYVVMVLERLEFTMTAFLRACGRLGVKPQWVAPMLRKLLRMLLHAGLVFGDLSPDNIMFRNVNRDFYSLALIDPQFLVSLEDFQRAMGHHRAEAFDTTYLALKIHAIGLLDPPVKHFTDELCSLVLGAPTPSEKSTRSWLSRDAPVGLFRAYDALDSKFSLPE